ncbi:MAG: type II secretion system protein [Oceanipulchritudo sp.]
MKKGEKTGWSLIEIAIVVTIIGILAALAIPLFSLILKRSRLSGLANDLRQHSQSILNYTMDDKGGGGDFPDSGPLLPDLEGYLSPIWDDPSPVGGNYSWHYVGKGNPKTSSAYIQISATGLSPFAIDLSDVVSLDRKIDDGNLGSGILQVAGNRIRYYVKLPAPNP